MPKEHPYVPMDPAVATPIIRESLTEHGFTEEEQKDHEEVQEALRIIRDNEANLQNKQQQSQ